MGNTYPIADWYMKTFIPIVSHVITRIIFTHIFLLLALAFVFGVLTSPQGASLVERIYGDARASYIYFLAQIFVGFASFCLSALAQIFDFQRGAGRYTTHQAYELFRKLTSSVPFIVLDLVALLFINDAGTKGWAHCFWVFVFIVSTTVYGTIIFEHRWTKGVLVWLSQIIQKSRTKVALIIASLFGVMPAALGGWLSVHHVEIFQDIGPLTTALVGLLSAASLASVIFVFVPLSLGSLKYAVFPCAAALLLSVLDGPTYVGTNADTTPSAMSNDSAYQSSTSTMSAAGLTKDTYERRLQIEPDFYLFAAEGGGIRAAFWAASILANLNIKLDGRLSEYAVAYSGVSGGSLGIAAWLAANQLPDRSPEQKREIVQTYLSSDFLSPLVAGLLFVDIPRVFFWRAWWASSRDSIFENALAIRWKVLTGDDFFSRKFLRDGVCDRPCLHPVVIFNTTEVSTGLSVPLSNENTLHYGKRTKHPIEALSRLTTLRDAPLSAFVHMSARFPYLSPPGHVGFWSDTLVRYHRDLALNPPEDLSRLESDPVDANLVAAIERLLSDIESGKLPSIVPAGKLVDGGYFDNSGSVTLDDVLGPLKSELRGYSNRAKQKKLEDDELHQKLSLHKIHFVQFSFGDPQSNQLELGKLPAVEANNNIRDILGWLAAPVETLLNAREARGLRTMENLERVSDTSFGFHVRAHTMSFMRVHSNRSEMVLRYSTMGSLEERLAREMSADVAHIDRLMKEKFFDVAQRSKEMMRVEKKYLNGLRDARELACLRQFRDSGDRNPPLGWTLAPKDIHKLKCFAAVAVFSKSLQD